MKKIKEIEDNENHWCGELLVLVMLLFSYSEQSFIADFYFPLLQFTTFALVK